MLEIGGIDDHIHILTSCPATLALAEFVRDIKANSSKRLREEKNLIRQYVRNQAEHHRTQSFEDEFRMILKRHSIAFDEKYLFEDEFHG
jgi:REP element-mobilizing transposase RayT